MTIVKPKSGHPWKFPSLKEAKKLIKKVPHFHTKIEYLKYQEDSIGGIETTGNDGRLCPGGFKLKRGEK